MKNASLMKLFSVNPLCFLKPLIEGYPMLDALSNYEFYEQGLVDRPVAATNHIEPFLEQNVPELWAYYSSVNV